MSPENQNHSSEPSTVPYLIAGSFVVLVFLTIIFVTTVLPAFTFNPEPSKVAHKYTAQELRGRNIYRREGCFYCHSQFSRYQDREGGEMVAAGDYAYETPHVLGTSRTGPDLSNIGGKYSDNWHRAHHLYPRKMKPGSIMPNYSYLSDPEMDDLVAYLQSIGSQRPLPSWIEAPQELRDEYDSIKSFVDVNSSAAANSGRGIYMQNCAQCHGVTGQGNGPVSQTMLKKPANFTRPYFNAYTDAMWYFRIKEGVPGTRMPRWGRSLGKEQMLYLTAFLKTLPRKSQTVQEEIQSLDQINLATPLSENYNVAHPAGQRALNGGYYPDGKKTEPAHNKAELNQRGGQ
jgi:cbb3-type cytochrome oxidase cytochrome c subunit/cytochrome c553